MYSTAPKHWIPNGSARNPRVAACGTRRIGGEAKSWTASSDASEPCSVAISSFVHGDLFWKSLVATSWNSAQDCCVRVHEANTANTYSMYLSDLSHSVKVAACGYLWMISIQTYPWTHGSAQLPNGWICQQSRATGDDSPSMVAYACVGVPISAPRPITGKCEWSALPTTGRSNNNYEQHHSLTKIVGDFLSKTV